MATPVDIKHSWTGVSGIRLGISNYEEFLINSACVVKTIFSHWVIDGIQMIQNKCLTYHVNEWV